MSTHDWPDPDEVRRWLDGIGDMYDRVERCAMTVMVEAARAYLRMLEQHAPTPMHCDEPRNPACSNSFDARDWARDFRATAKALGYCDMDEGWLIGWFANAIMRGWDEHAKQQPAEPMITEWERKRVTELAWLLRANERIPDAFPSEDLKGLVPPIKMLVSIVERVIHANHASCFDGCETLMPQPDEPAPVKPRVVESMTWCMYPVTGGAEWAIAHRKNGGVVEGVTTAELCELRSLLPQPAEPALTIEQVIAACKAGDYESEALQVWRSATSWHANLCDRTVTADTPEAAIQQLGRDAIAKLRERHAADAAKLKELGVEP